MESSERLVRTWMASGREDEVNQMVEDISLGHSKLLELVKALGEYLTSEEDVMRSKGIDFLSRVLNRCPPDRISRQATRVLTNFYTGKLDDAEAIHPALKGLVPLTALPTFTTVDAIDTAKALFERVDLMSHPQAIRFLVFQVLDSLMARHRDALQTMGDDFLDGYTNLIDGEKDPRNLMLAFSIDRVICIEFDISRHVEKLFNIVFCYFPIAFKPPPDNAIEITSDDLKVSLRSCLDASPLFGRLAIPLFLEKLLAGSPATKKDTLETMETCIPAYGPGAVGPFGKKLWNSLKLEIFQPVNPELEMQSLKTVQVLIRTLYKGLDESEDGVSEVRGLVEDICKECIELMGEPEKSQAIPASKVVAALVGTTANISRYALSQSIPHLMKLFRNPDELIHRPQILTLLCITISAIAQNQSALERFGLQAQLLSFKDDILGAFVAGLKASNSREASLEGLKKLCEMRDVLADDEILYVVHNINEVLVGNGEDVDGTSDNVLDVLIAIAGKHSKVIEESTLPLLFNSLPDIPPSLEDTCFRMKYWRTLRWLARLCSSVPLFETLVIRLTTKLDIIYFTKTDNGASADNELRDAYAHNLLKTLSSVLEVKVNAKDVDVPKYISHLVPRLFSLFINLSAISRKVEIDKLDPRVLTVAGNVITLVVQTVAPERQKLFAQDLYNVFYNGNLSPLTVGHQKLPSDLTFSPFKGNSSQKELISLLAAAVIAFDKGVLLPDMDPNELLTKLQLWSLDAADSQNQCWAAHHIIASYINKNAPDVTQFISEQINAFWVSEVNNKLSPPPRRRNAISSWVWVKNAKALVLQSHPLAHPMVEMLFELFEDEDICWDAAKAIGRIASGEDEVLTKRNHAIIRVLSTQKYFRVVLPKILENLNAPIQSARQTASLVALSSLISSLPKSIYADEMHILMPHLIRGMDLSDIQIKTGIIDTLLTVAEAGGVTEEYATTLVPVILKIALPLETTSTDLRIAALRYLAAIPSVVRYDVLHPHKPTVLRELGKALDDPKRAVRKQAVNARTAWYLYRG